MILIQFPEYKLRCLVSAFKQLACYTTSPYTCDKTVLKSDCSKIDIDCVDKLELFLLSMGRSNHLSSSRQKTSQQPVSVAFLACASEYPLISYCTALFELPEVKKVLEINKWTQQGAQKQQRRQTKLRCD